MELAAELVGGASIVQIIRFLIFDPMIYVISEFHDVDTVMTGVNEGLREEIRRRLRK